MTITRLSKVMTLGFMFIALAILATPVLAQDQLLTHPSFEGGSYLHDGDSKLEAPTGWSIWWDQPVVNECYDSTPTFEVTTDGSAKTGPTFVRYFTSYASHNAGLWQAVKVESGQWYEFTMYGYAKSGAGPDSASTSTSQMMIGIDPQGGVSPHASSIVWSTAKAAMDSWQQFSVTAQAAGSQVTVWVRNRPDTCAAWNFAYWDDGKMFKVSAPAAAEAPTQAAAAAPAVASGPYVLATPDANGRLVHTVQVGDTLSQIAWQYGTTVEEIKRLNGLTNDFAVLGVQLVIREGGEQSTAPPAEEAAAEAPVEGEPAAVEEAPTQAEETEPLPADSAGNGTVCVMSYDDSNSNGLREADEAKVAGITFTLSDGTQVVGRYTTDAISEPYCFADLTPGTYIVSWTGDTFQPTTEQSWTVDVGAGSIQSREFGALPLQGGAAADAGDGGEGGGMPGWLIALLGALGVIIVLGGAGVAIYYFVIQRQTI